MCTSIEADLDKAWQSLMTRRYIRSRTQPGLADDQLIAARFLPLMIARFQARGVRCRL